MNFYSNDLGLDNEGLRLLEKTLIKMMELSSEHESVDYSITPMPIEHMEKLPTDYIDFH